jgi:hemoglobin/transferrin/lactoferrin receptor protein
MKFSFILVILSSLYLQTIAQEVLILHQQNSIPIENVAVFNKNLTRVVYSNNQGVADLSQFSKSDSVFFKHPSIEQIGLSFQDIREMNFVLQIDKRNIIMDDIVVTASRWAEKKREVPFMTDVIRMSDSKVAILQTSSDILTSTGNLMVQKSQGGAGSPVIRGFEANRLLLVVDGVRMNNAIYRSGHLQNSMSLDLGGLDRIEVIYGPSSVIYGSDALGGVIHYYTKSPKQDDKKFLQVGADAAAQFSSANNAKIYHL